jgi:hypothetical protein
VGYGNKRVRNRRYDALTRVDWQQLEVLLATYYRGQGYDVEHTGTAASGSRYDGGVDLKLRRAAEYVLVQVKHWNAYRVPHNDVHQLLGIMVNEGATGAIVVTSGEFTKAAIEAATRHGHVQLVDGEDLRRMLGHIPEPVVGSRNGNLSGTFAESAMERLLAAAEQRIRGETTRRVSGAAKLGLGFAVAKIMIPLIALIAIVWAFNLWVGMATDGLQRSLTPRHSPQRPTPAPTAVLPAPQSRTGQPAVLPPSTGYFESGQRTLEEIAEARRRADEAMRVLAPNTPEVERMPQRQ